jgi:hypothetical protein
MGQDALFLAIVGRVIVSPPYERFHINILMLIYILIYLLSRFFVKKMLDN